LLPTVLAAAIAGGLAGAGIGFLLDDGGSAKRPAEKLPAASAAQSPTQAPVALAPEPCTGSRRGA
jgi:hypothetical protein